MYKTIFDGGKNDQRVAVTDQISDNEVYVYDWSGSNPDNTEDGPVIISKPDNHIAAFKVDRRVRSEFYISSGEHVGKRVICGIDTTSFLSRHWGIPMQIGSKSVNGDKR